eukprot:TRINITY_DN4748_c0_g1_i2.p1 TRINITY_DN4748_c0_g1~~TRINITY_DN4748_c0_g1_i2.p1  ORF type:complete len:177 (+),score=55.45 TRINITY_DN4748_c0_g1_i2:1250-1780(+)
MVLNFRIPRNFFKLKKEVGLDKRSMEGVRQAAEKIIQSHTDNDAEKGYPGSFWIKTLSDATPLPVKWMNLTKTIPKDATPQDFKKQVEEELKKEEERYQQKLIPDTKEKQTEIGKLKEELTKHKTASAQKEGKDAEKAAVISTGMEDQINDLSNQIRFNQAVDAQCRAARFVLAHV